MISEQEKIRRDKLLRLIELGINPYPADEYVSTFSSTEMETNFEEGKEVKVAGRLMSRRIQGKASFAELQDFYGKVQLYFNRDIICEGDDKTMYNEVYKKLLDIGDIIGVKGNLFTTKVGEKTIEVKSFILLSKSLRPLPLPKTDSDGNVYDAFSDSEQRYRQRYIDLIVNPDVKKVFLKRTKIINTMRDFLNNLGYLEVETPILQPIPGGAAARPFVTHHNSLNIPLYLRIANELYLKRLIVGGFEGVFEFAKDFINEGMDKTHNPEFTMLEFYVAYKDYKWMMKTTENLFEKIAVNVNGSTKLSVGNEIIDFKAPFNQISIFDSIEEHTGMDVSKKNVKELNTICLNLGIETDETMGKGKLIDEIFGKFCEGKYIQPTFIIDYPKEMSPLTKTHRNKQDLTERFELIINGKEIANAYSELNNPIEQLNRFEDQLELSEKGDDEAMFIDKDFVKSLEYGMPPTAGIGIGIDRLTMLITNMSSIQEVLFFPQMKPVKKTISLNDEEKEVFSFLSSSKDFEINEIKNNSGLSNKKWDKTIKLLKSKSLIEVFKKNESFYIKKIIKN
ncbi:MAG: lysine--tRNA ligase [Flavobacteriales bacterium]|nr:lysine--tRNA ligase [Flavobacteriales bacterium]